MRNIKGTLVTMVTFINIGIKVTLVKGQIPVNALECLRYAQ
jgi:hypothetical protein